MNNNRLVFRNDDIVNAYLEFPTEETVAGLAEMYGMKKSDIRLILLNYGYRKGEWERQFNPK
jgi:serine protease inhibitor